MSNELEKKIRKTSFSIYNKFFSIDSFQLLSSLFETFVENLGKNDLRYLRQEFDSELLF